jgi:integrator complex subunit 1
VFLQHVQLQAQQLPDESSPPVSTCLEQLPQSAMLQKRGTISQQTSAPKTDVSNLINQLFIEKVSMSQKADIYRRLHKILAKDLHKCGTESDRGAVVLAIKHILSVLSSIQVILGSTTHECLLSCNTKQRM